MRYARLLKHLAGSALRRPGLLLPLLSAGWRFRARGWYRRPPFLPLPPREYVEWRLHTAYGDAEALPPAEDLARYLAWAARLMKGTRGSSHQASGPNIHHQAGSSS